MYTPGKFCTCKTHHLSKISTSLIIFLVCTVSGQSVIYNAVAQKLSTGEVTLLVQNRQLEAQKLLETGTKQLDDDQNEAALQSFQQALAIYQQIKDRQGEGKALQAIASAYLDQNNADRAGEYSGRSLAIAREIKDRELEGKSLSIFAVSYMVNKEFSKALNYQQQALAIAREIKNRELESQILRRIANIYNVQNNQQKAIDYYQQSLAIARQIQDRKSQALAIGQIGNIYQKNKDDQQAINYYQQGLLLAREIKSRKLESGFLAIIGNTYKSLKDNKKALEYFQQAAKVYLETKKLSCQSRDLYSLGGAYQLLGEYTKSIEYYNQALAIERKTNKHDCELDILTTVGDIYNQNLKDYPKAITYFEQSVKLARQSQNRNLETRTLLVIGWAYGNNLGNFQQGITYLEQAVAIAREIKNLNYEGEALAVLGSYYNYIGNLPKGIETLGQAVKLSKGTQVESAALANLAAAYLMQGDTQKAIDSSQQAIKIAQGEGSNQTIVLESSDRRKPPLRLSAKNRDIEGLALVILGATYFAGQDNYQKARELFQQGLAIGQESKNKFLESFALTYLSLADQNLREYPQAIDFAKQSLAIAQEIKSPIAKILPLFSLAGIYRDLGDYPQAIAFYQQAQTLARQTQNRSMEGIALVALSDIYYIQGDDRKTIEFSQQAAVAFEESKSPLMKGTALLSLSYGYAGLGDYPKAIASAKEALVITRQLKNRGLEYITLGHLGFLHRKSGQTQQALAFYEQALKTNPTPEIPGSEASVRQGLARVYRTLNQPAKAIEYYKQAVSGVEQVRQKIQGLPPQLQASFLQAGREGDKTVDIYRELADLLLTQGQVAQAQQVLDLVKLQELKDYFNIGQESRLRQGQTNQRIPEKVVALGKELDSLESIQPSSKRTIAQQKRIIELRKIQTQLQKEFGEFLKTPEVVALVSQLQQNTGGENLNLQTQVRTIQDNLKRLQQDAVILYPFVLKDRLEIVLVTPYSPPIHRTVAVSEQELNITIDEFRKDLHNPSRNAQANGLKLYQWLIKPIKNDLAQAKTKTIIYAPDGKLRYIPLAALYDGKQWLVENFRINNITALSLMDFNTNPQPQLQVLAAAFADTKRSVTVKVGQEKFTLQGLPFAGREVEDIASIINNTKKFIDNQFNSDIVYLMNDYSVVHLATHAAFVVGQPEDSFIVFGDGEYVTLRDVQNWNLPNVDLIVLSACETGVGGKLGDGREILGFGYQMQRTGAKSAIASLWSVDDGGTQAFMDAFYAALQQPNTSKSQALQKAQLALITGDFSSLGKQRGGIIREPVQRINNSLPRSVNNQLNHPYYWAPFILIGNGL